MDLKIEIFIDKSKISILKEFEDFTEKIMFIDKNHLNHLENAKIHRVGTTNAADRGLDMYTNWGYAIQVKHLSLSLEMAENITNSLPNNKIIIVCKDSEKYIIISILTQIGWKSNIQSVITENDLINWYEKALRGKYAIQIGDKLLMSLFEEISNEFPAIYKMPDVLKNRHYENISDEFWI